MKLVSPESVGLDSSVLENIWSYLDETYVKDGKYVGTLTLVARKGKIAYLDSLGLMDRENKKPMQEDAIFRIYSNRLLKFFAIPAYFFFLLFYFITSILTKITDFFLRIF